MVNFFSFRKNLLNKRFITFNDYYSFSLYNFNLLNYYKSFIRTFYSHFLRDYTDFWFQYFSEFNLIKNDLIFITKTKNKLQLFTSLIYNLKFNLKFLTVYDKSFFKYENVIKNLNLITNSFNFYFYLNALQQLNFYTIFNNFYSNLRLYYIK
jgi:hypothetical protein